MIRLKMKNYNIVLKKKQAKHQHYHLKKLINYLTGEEIFPSNKGQIINQVTFSYSPLEKAFKKEAVCCFKASKTL